MNRLPPAPPPVPKTSPSIHSDSHFSGIWEHGFTLLAGAIHTLAGSIHTLVHTFWQGNGLVWRSLDRLCHSHTDFAKPFSFTLPLPPPPTLLNATSLPYPQESRHPLLSHFLCLIITAVCFKDSLSLRLLIQNIGSVCSPLPIVVVVVLRVALGRTRNTQRLDAARAPIR